MSLSFHAQLNEWDKAFKNVDQPINKCHNNDLQKRELLLSLLSQSKQLYVINNTCPLTVNLLALAFTLSHNKKWATSIPVAHPSIKCSPKTSIYFLDRMLVAHDSYLRVDCPVSTHVSFLQRTCLFFATLGSSTSLFYLQEVFDCPEKVGRAVHTAHLRS